jgi:hypothetical protein
MWYKKSDKEPNKQEPSYELKVIGIDAEQAIRKLCYLQGNYNPSDIEIERKIKKLLSHLREKYGSIANVRLYSKGDTLQKIISENVYELFGKVNKR